MFSVGVIDLFRRGCVTNNKFQRELWTDNENSYSSRLSGAGAYPMQSLRSIGEIFEKI
ncbi:hypothetical protein MSG28_001433 [Choristoneura fumiferana]|uniref:Uncharacterized protein n=1 Tax=Choristoneura fumiferana TaxID=7141 RepID=A0ACC0KUJ2_CHOFU|nr:hypothetical protein MSG28_001433 [Choristoneura fumiferana]